LRDSTCKKTGRYYWLTLICYVIVAFGVLVIFAFSGPIKRLVPAMVAGTMLCAFSNGIGITSTLIAIISNTDQKEQAVATACSYLFRSMGSVFGLAISATAVNQMLRLTLREELGTGQEADKIADTVRRSLDSIKTLDPTIRGLVRDCYARSTSFAFGVNMIVVLGAVIAASFIQETRLLR